MTPHDLIAAFDAVAEAPDGVQRLRELILQLAVRGKLVPQDPADEPAIAVVRRAREEQASLVTSKEIPAPPPTTEIEAANAPHELPESWVWAPLGHVVAVLDFMRRPIKQADRETSISGKPQCALYPYYGATQQAGWIDEYIFDEELVLLGEDGAPFFKPGKHVAYVVSGRYWVNNHAHALRGLGVLNAYICHVLNQTSYEGLVSGTTRLKLTQAKMVQIPVPVPALAEQRRIVARVDELMGLLDRLEVARTTRDATRAAVRESTLDALREADKPDEVEVAWNRCAERLDDLLCDPADIAPLRQTILQLAVRGRLVPQDPADEPASVRLAGRVQSPSLDDAPFPLPSGWAWSSVSKLGRVLGGGTPSKDNAAFWNGNIPWVTPKDMKRDLIADSQDHITEAAVSGSSLKRVAAGALLMVVRGMILAHSFPTGLTTTEVTVNQDMKALVPFDGTVGRFLLLVTKGLKPEVLSLVERSTHGTCKLPTDDLFHLPIPIAPWAEQRRIVARVDELMGLLDRLEERLAAARTAHVAFAAAAVHHLDA